MAKGKTNQPLTIAVVTEWMDRPEIQALKAQGHRIDAVTHTGYDLVLSPVAHLWNDMQWDYLPAALAAARKRKREAK